MRARHAWLLALSMTSTATAFATPPCDAPEYRQFDFWIGDWQVFKPDGTVAGTNRIEQEYGGCVRQHWQSTDATGTCVTAFDGLYRRRVAP